MLAALPKTRTYSPGLMLPVFLISKIVTVAPFLSHEPFSQPTVTRKRSIGGCSGVGVPMTNPEEAASNIKDYFAFWRGVNVEE